MHVAELAVLIIGAYAGIAAITASIGVVAFYSDKSLIKYSAAVKTMVIGWAVFAVCYAVRGYV